MTNLGGGVGALLAVIERSPEMDDQVKEAVNDELVKAASRKLSDVDLKQLKRKVRLIKRLAEFD